MLGARSETSRESTVRSNLVGNAGSRPISEAKQPWACPVLGWGTTGEAHVLYSFYPTFSIDHPHSEVRAFRRIPHFCPHLTSTLAKSLTHSQAQSLTVAVFDPFRPLFSCPFRAGSGLPFLWVRFPHSPCTCSSPLPLHPIYIAISSPRPDISRSRSTSLSVSILSHLQRALYSSHPCFSLSISLPLISILVSPHRVYTYCDITHNPSSFRTTLQVLVYSAQLVSLSAFPLSLG